MTFFRPCWAEIDTAAFRHNLSLFRSLVSPQTTLLAVLKANAYGHGVVPLAQICEADNVNWIGVASLDEGIQLRRAGIQTPVLIMGSLFPFEGFTELFKQGLTPTVASLQAAEALSDLAQKESRRLPVHLKIDTGFGRTGVSTANAVEFAKLVSVMPGVQIDGIYTQLSTADDPDTAYAEGQIRAFHDVLSALREAGIAPTWIHLANSAAAMRFPRAQGNLIRPGLGLYGMEPFAHAREKHALRPILSWKTRVVFLKKIPAGSSVSYGNTWTATRPTKIATLAVGYGDGYRRLFSNQAYVLIRGARASVVGRVTMDMTMVDVTDIPMCDVGDEVVLLGTQGRETLSAEQLALWAQTNAYEITCGITERVTRVFK